MITSPVPAASPVPSALPAASAGQPPVTAASSVTLPMGQVPDAPALLHAAGGGSGSVGRMGAAPGNTIHLLTDEGEVLPALIDSIRGAKQQIDMAMFSWQPSGAGQKIADELIAKARQGVKVHVTVDQVGSMDLPLTGGRRFFENLRAQGVDVRSNTRVSRDGVAPVDHRKLLIVDGTTAFTGGMNLSSKFGKWHDVMVRMEGPVAAQLGAEFLGRWVDLGGSISDHQAEMIQRGTAALSQGRAGVAVLTNKPGVDLHASDALLENIAKAEKRVWIETPTLSNPEVVDALVAAAKRGVDARVTVSGPEGWIGTRALGVIGSAFYPELVNGGVKVYEQPGMSHAKVSLVDDVASVGSLNMTRRAMLWDHEMNVASDEAGFRRQIEGLFTTDFGRSHLVGPEDASRAAVKVAAAVKNLTGLKW